MVSIVENIIEEKIYPQHQIDYVEQEEDNIPFKQCGMQKACGHTCKGVLGESRCLPCLDSGCIAESIRQK